MEINRFERFREFLKRDLPTEYSRCRFDSELEEVYYRVSDEETAYLFFPLNNVRLGSIDNRTGADLGYVEVPSIMTDDWLWLEFSRTYLNAD